MIILTSTPQPRPSHIAPAVQDTFSAHDQSSLARRMAETASAERAAAIKRDGKGTPLNLGDSKRSAEKNGLIILSAIVGKMSAPQIATATGLSIHNVESAVMRLVRQGKLTRTVVMAGKRRRAWYEVAS